MHSAPEGFYFQASNGSVALPVAGYDYNSDRTPLLAGLSPAGMAASLAAPEPAALGFGAHVSGHYEHDQRDCGEQRRDNDPRDAAPSTTATDATGFATEVVVERRAAAAASTSGRDRKSSRPIHQTPCLRHRSSKYIRPSGSNPTTQ